MAEGLRNATISVAQPDTRPAHEPAAGEHRGPGRPAADRLARGTQGPPAGRGPSGDPRADRWDLRAGHERGITARAAALGLPPRAQPLRRPRDRRRLDREADRLRVRAGALPGGPLEAFAYRFESDGRSAVVAGRAGPREALIAFARGADVLVHEAAFIPDPETAAKIGRRRRSRPPAPRDRAPHPAGGGGGARAAGRRRNARSGAPATASGLRHPDHERGERQLRRRHRHPDDGDEITP